MQKQKKKCVKLNQKHYQIFRRECERWTKRFELDNWGIVYEFKKLNGSDARVVADEEYDTTIYLSVEMNNIPNNISVNNYVKQLAKHECLHLLLGKLNIINKYKSYSRKDYILEDERLVHKLIKIIN